MMADAVLLENIYFALSQADRETTARGKIGYLLTAASLLEALVEKDRLTGPITITKVKYELEQDERGNYKSRRPSEVERVTLNTTDEITLFIEKHIISSLIQVASLPHTAMLDKVWELGYKPDWGELRTIQIFSYIEEIKSLLLKLLVALDLANVALVDIATKLEKSTRRNTTT
nr:hypothetical protein [Thermococcus nautili]